MADLKVDIPLTDEELALAQRGSVLIATAMAHPEASAPQALRESLEAARAAQPSRRRRGPSPRRLLAPGMGLTGALAVVLVAALGGSGDGPQPLSVVRVAALARLPAQHAAPRRVGGRRAHLSAAVQGLAFADWSAKFGWLATGRRTDRVGGRAVTTVFYRYEDGTRLGYSIVAGSPLGSAAGRDVARAGMRFRVLRRAGRTTVTWTQAGHTCVVDAPAAVPADELVTLAAWADS